MTVEWTDYALDQLADIWVTITPAERDVIEQTVDAINARLAVDPSSVGESRADNRRVWFRHPLVVIYRLVPGGGVIVSHVAKLRPWRADDNGAT
jgi:plasmid stabilization system protein ParE